MPRKSIQFGLGSLFRLLTVLASTAAILAWTKPYLAVGADPPLNALPILAIAAGVFVLAILYPGKQPTEGK